MSPRIVSVLGLALGLIELTARAQSVNFRMYSYSVEFDAHVTGGTNPTTNRLSRSSDFINNELIPVFEEFIETHAAYYFRTSGSVRWTNALFLYLPSADANRDGVPDFFQREFGHTNVTSTGQMESSELIENQAIQATWSREPGSLEGTCILTINLPEYSGTFAHQYRLREYQGAFEFSRDSDAGSGAIGAIRVANPAFGFSTDASFSVKDRDNVAFGGGVWRRGASLFQTEGFILTRTNSSYTGFMRFDGWDQEITRSEHLAWVVQIVDSRDGDFDGIPDFSDPATVAESVVRMERRAAQLRLTWSDPGRLYGLLMSSSLGPAATWIPVQGDPTHSNGVSSWETTPATSSMFFRLGPR